jgi:hypothetical protein
MVAKEFLDSDRVNFLVWRFVTTSRPRLTITAPSRLLAFSPSLFLPTSGPFADHEFLRAHRFLLEGSMYYVFALKAPQLD